jgi:hypothetical protein
MLSHKPLIVSLANERDRVKWAEIRCEERMNPDNHVETTVDESVINRFGYRLNSVLDEGRYMPSGEGSTLKLTPWLPLPKSLELARQGRGGQVRNLEMINRDETEGDCLLLTCKKETAHPAHPSITTQSIHVDYMVGTENPRPADDVEEMPHDVARITYEGWPDHGVPKGEEGLAEFVDLLRTVAKEHQKDPSRPIWVHCVAGVGRTGTFITAYSVWKQALLHKEQHGALPSDPELKEMIVNAVLAGRKQRNEYYVQTPEQLALAASAVTRLLETDATEVIRNEARETTLPA